MTSVCPIEANGRNCRGSTGPRSLEGKRISSQNAKKLGIFAQSVLLVGEDPKELNALSRRLLCQLQPVGELEKSLADLLVASLWRWRRLHRIEADLCEMYRVYDGRDGGPATALAQDAGNMDCFSRLARSETALERRVFRLIHELQRLQANRLGQPSLPPVSIDLDVSASG